MRSGNTQPGNNGDLSESPSPAKLPSIVYRLGWISFFADVCSEMAYPIMPLFVIGTLRQPKSALGIIEGVALAVVSFMRAWSGFASDRSGRRVPYIQWGYLSAGVSKPIIGMANVWTTVLFGRILDRFGKGIRTTARDALLADSVDKADYGRAYGFHQGMDTAGAFLGVMITFALLSLFPGQYRTIFFIAAGPGLIAWFITLTLKDRPVDVAKQAVRPKFALSSLSSAYWRAVVISGVFALANSSDAFLMLRASNIGLSDSKVALTYALYNFVFTLFSYPIGRLSDRVGRWPALAVGWLLYGLVYLGFAGANPTSIWFLFCLYGVSIGISTAVNKALVADLAPKENRGAALGIFHLVVGVGTLAGNWLIGEVWDVYGASPAFILGGAFAAAAVALIFITWPFQPRKAP